MALLPVGGILLGLAGITLAGTMIGLALATPVFVILSPVIIPAALTVGLAVAGFLTSGTFWLTGLSSLSFLVNCVRQATGRLPEKMENVKGRMQDMAVFTGKKTKEVGQKIKNKAHEVGPEGQGQSQSQSQGSGKLENCYIGFKWKWIRGRKRSKTAVKNVTSQNLSLVNSIFPAAEFGSLGIQNVRIPIEAAANMTRRGAHFKHDATPISLNTNLTGIHTKIPYPNSVIKRTGHETVIYRRRTQGDNPTDKARQELKDILSESQKAIPEKRSKQIRYPRKLVQAAALTKSENSAPIDILRMISSSSSDTDVFLIVKSTEKS
ncbi:hypothetical protein Ccrd_005148 [Cynara cardunculus var. scolymus]|uniref:Oleosin n=1 Tax=Cynara cardunculus var. scolymus TaxID=59895 RepID=A0A103XL68_CYNCS|nr:hypothetical protein Ccrd_005148 [Cynara cardunculus var. scolymus]